MENQHKSGKIIPKRWIVNTRWFLGILTEINWVDILRVSENIE